MSFTILFSNVLFAQGEFAVPFLLISSSANANSWGDIGSAVIFDDPTSVIANPAHLGFFGMNNFVSASTYTEKVPWLKQFRTTDLNYNVYGLNAGVNVAREFDVPLPIIVGAGYSHVRLDLGEFIRTNANGQELGRFSAFETAEQFSVGVGVDVHVKLSVGWNFKKIVSSLSPAGTLTELGAARAEPSATDFGVMAQLPVFDIVGALSNGPVTLTEEFEPLLDFTFGYALATMGDEVKHITRAQADPLPRNASLGLSTELGIIHTTASHHWNIFLFTLVREASDLLVVRASDGSFKYQSGLGDISFFDNLIRGKVNDRENVHRGWQLNFGEIVSLRGGSFSEGVNFGNRNNTTSGFGLRLRGIYRLIDALSESPIESDVLTFIANHLDIAFDHTEYANHELLVPFQLSFPKNEGHSAAPTCTALTHCIANNSWSGTRGNKVQCVDAGDSIKHRFHHHSLQLGRSRERLFCFPSVLVS